MNEGTEELTLLANATRSRLLSTVEQLDRKRRDILDVKKQLKRHLVPLAVAGGAIALLLFTSFGLFIYRMAHASERKRRERRKMLSRLWNHPERAARREPKSFLGQLVRSVTLGIATAMIMIPIRRALPR
jgi:hypothetical protein